MMTAESMLSKRQHLGIYCGLCIVATPFLLSAYEITKFDLAREKCFGFVLPCYHYIWLL